MYMNQLTIIGFSGNDAEAHYTPNGTLVTTLSIATKESWKDADGQWQSRTEWHRVVTFGKLAEYARTLSKGTHLMVQGAVRSAQPRIRARRCEAPRIRASRRHDRQAGPR